MRIISQRFGLGLEVCYDELRAGITGTFSVSINIYMDCITYIGCTILFQSLEKLIKESYLADRRKILDRDQSRREDGQ